MLIALKLKLNTKDQSLKKMMILDVITMNQSLKILLFHLIKDLGDMYD
jgi:hypothetical protein